MPTGIYKRIEEQKRSRREKMGLETPESRIGKRLGGLTIKGYRLARLWGRMNILYKAQCDCGTILEYTYQNILRNKYGCLKCFHEKRRHQWLDSLLNPGRDGWMVTKILKPNTLEVLCKPCGRKFRYSHSHVRTMAYKESAAACRKCVQRIAVEKSSVTKRKGTGVKIGKETKLISEWGRLLGISRQRAHQLHNQGRLIDRVVNK